jgi:hypothetical protein
MTRHGRQNRETARAYNVGVDGYISLFTSIFCTRAKVKGIEQGRDGLTSTYILRTLYTRGAIAYDKQTRLWLRYSGVGEPNAYGEPRRVRLWGFDGVNFERERDDVYLFKANALAFPWAVLIAQKSAFLSELDGAIAQNLDAVKQMTYITAENELVGRMLAVINKRREQGESVAILNPYAFGDDNEAAAAGATLQGVNVFKTGADFLIDKLKEAKRQEYDEIIHLLGVQTGYEKGERMTDNEIEAFNGETNACLSILATTFNTDAEAQGAPFRIVICGDLPKEEEQEETPTAGFNGVTNNDDDYWGGTL